MATAIEKVTLGRGYDPRDFTVIGYGGGSGLFIAEVCRDLGIEKLVMPRAAATFSAYGLLFADAIHAESTTAQWIYGAGDGRQDQRPLRRPGAASRRRAAPRGR